MQGTVVQKRSFTVVGVSQSGSHNDVNDKNLIGLLWKQISARRFEIQSCVSSAKITGVCIPPASPDYYYLAGVEVTRADHVPEGMTTLTFPTLTYVVFKHTGPVTKLFNTYRQIWDKWFPSTGFQMIGGPELEIVDIERFPDPSAENYEMDIHIPVLKSADSD